MKYNTDTPIENQNQDLLGRSVFSSHLGKAIYEYDGEDGLVIGLFGKWGTGKTSIINMALNEVKKLACNDVNPPLIMKFSPWNYSNKDNLISMFFQCLKNKIEIQGSEELKKKVGKALCDYSGAIDALSLVPVVGSGLAAVLKTIAQTEGANLMQGPDLEETKDILVKALREAEKKIIIVIDDIDRLTNSQIRDIFQLVKQVGDFPNVIYVLAMDRNVVCNALGEVHKIDGEEYLEKIIQVPFELPELRKSKLNQILFDKLDQFIADLSDKIVLDQNYWSDVFNNCVDPYIHTLRDVNRVINTFQFKYMLLYQETSFEDMIGLTTLEVLEPQLYKWIANNKDAVCGGFMHSLLSSNDHRPDFRKLYHDEFDRLGIDSDRAIRCLSTMFPVFAKDVNEVQNVYKTTSNIRANMRIAYEGRFELYFMFDLEDVKVPRYLINECINKLDREDLYKVIEAINGQGNIEYFVDEMRTLVEDIPNNRLNLIASVLLNLQGEFQGERVRTLFSRSAKDTAEYLAIDIIKKIELEEERYSIVRTAVENVSYTGLGTVARIINRIELAYGRLAGQREVKDEQIISLEHLEELEKEYVIIIKSIAKAEPILDNEEFNIAFYLWECFEKEGAKEFVENLFNDEVKKLKFLCALAGKWNGTNGSGWSFYYENYKQYLSKEDAYDMIHKFDKGRIEELSEIEQIKLASFVLNYNRNEMNHVTEQEAMKLVQEWKNK